MPDVKNLNLEDGSTLIHCAASKGHIKILECLLGGFQLEFVSISGVINHMTCYKFECSHW